eukprot:Nitzschia sp. Nitz4//scaffold185_size43419//33921//35729//NITZ4_007307-RA/size43419-processed-gene-0.83-mRNA-1//-1//CDS//3329539727//8288//frame0
MCGLIASRAAALTLVSLLAFQCFPLGYSFAVWTLPLGQVASTMITHQPPTQPTSTEFRNTLRPTTALFRQVSTEGQLDAQLCDQSLSELYADCLPSWLLEKCTECGWEYPTLIQKKVFDELFLPYNKEDDLNITSGSGNNSVEDTSPSLPVNSMVIEAQTGSGKTLTYLLPLLAKLIPRQIVQAMVVVPTRELGLQVAKVVKRLVGRRFMIMSVLQGSQLKRQRAWAWADTPHMVIGTPQELLEMVQYGGIPKVNSIHTVVVDEVDACLVHRSGGSLGATSRAKSSSLMASALHTLLSRYLSPTYPVDQLDDDGNKVSMTVATDPLTRLVFGDAAVMNKARLQLRTRQTIFASATIPQRRHFLQQCVANQWTMEEPTLIRTSPNQALPPTLKHTYMVCSTSEKKLAALRRVLTKIYKSQGPQGRVLVFCQDTRPLHDFAKVIEQDLSNDENNVLLFRSLKYKLQQGNSSTKSDTPSRKGRKDNFIDPKDFVLVSVLSHKDELLQRSGATEAFASEGNFRVLLTSDMAARGLDIAGITHVIHFDLAPDADTYLHRAGRTGRLGKSGRVLSIVPEKQVFVLERMANALEIEVQCIGRQVSSSRQ